MIKRFLLKTALLLIIFNLPLIGVTDAMLADTEISSANAMTTASLDFSLVFTGDFSPDTLIPGNSSTRSVLLAKIGSLDFQYNLSASQTGGDSDLCNALQIEARLAGVTQYTGSLLSLNLLTPVVISGSLDDWEFFVSLNNYDSSLQSKTCDFDLVFNGEQVGGGGFTDQESLGSNINSGTWGATDFPDVVLNEILPNTKDDYADKPEGEWVELYNKSDSPVSVTGWHLADSIGTPIPITGDRTDTGGTDISGHGFLVVYMNSAILNNGGDTVNLYDGAVDPANLIDSHIYGFTPKGKSIARIPDGWGDWYDPIPTPGGPNRLEPENEVEAELAGEVNEGVEMEEQAEGTELGNEPEEVAEEEAVEESGGEEDVADAEVIADEEEVEVEEDLGEEIKEELPPEPEEIPEEEVVEQPPATEPPTEIQSEEESPEQTPLPEEENNSDE